MKDLSKDLKISDFTTNEFLALLDSLYGGASHNPSKDPHTVYYGGGSLCVTFRSKTREIRKVMADESSGLVPRLKEAVATILGGTSEIKLQHAVVFTQGAHQLLPFRWHDAWQIGPMPDGAPMPSVAMAEFPWLFQFSYIATGLPWLDAERSRTAFRQSFLPLPPIMANFDGAFLCNPYFFSSRNTWALNHEGGHLKPVWVQQGYIWSGMPETVNFLPYLGLKFSLWPPENPDTWDYSFRRLWQPLIALDSLKIDSPQMFSQFLVACHWYHKALVADSMTDRFLFNIIMIESLLDNDSDRCAECNQPKYQISKKFKEFIEKYTGLAPDAPILKTLYSLRSAISHEGQSLAGESLGWGAFVPKDLSDQRILMQLRRMLSAVLVNWLIVAAEEAAEWRT